mgnify:CR=1 FL=1
MEIDAMSAAEVSTDSFLPVLELERFLLLQNEIYR